MAPTTSENASPYFLASHKGLPQHWVIANEHEQQPIDTQWEEPAKLRITNHYGLIEETRHWSMVSLQLAASDAPDAVEVIWPEGMGPK
jgi:hypothetical protein